MKISRPAIKVHKQIYIKRHKLCVCRVPVVMVKQGTYTILVEVRFRMFLGRHRDLVDCLSCLSPFVLLLPKLIIWLTNLSILSAPNDGYSRNPSCALNLISTFYYGMFVSHEHKFSFAHVKSRAFLCSRLLTEHDLSSDFKHE